MLLKPSWTLHYDSPTISATRALDKDIRVDNDLLPSRQWRLSIHPLASLDTVWLCWRCFLLVEIGEIHLVVDVWE
jgi:hypothetical protein